MMSVIKRMLLLETVIKLAGQEDTEQQIEFIGKCREAGLKWFEDSRKSETNVIWRCAEEG